MSGHLSDSRARTHARTRRPAGLWGWGCALRVRAISYELTKAKDQRQLLAELALAVPASVALAFSVLYVFLSVGLYV